MAHPATGASRDDRLHQDKPAGARSPAQRDRDRVLYTSAFRRLAGVTQVVAADEGHVFHNRLTHSLEVAQFGRRLAEKLARDNLSTVESLGLDPDVVEAACLAHDLGHPPFGHVAETQLNELVTRSVLGGFEGNAQAFRIVTKLALQSSDIPGLNLTRATLNAILKYPWLRGTGGIEKLKWGAYQTENAELNWARELMGAGSKQQSLEAAIMDWADDVTYAVHDAMDFYRAGLIPLERLASGKDDTARKYFLDEVFDRHRRSGLPLLPESDFVRAFEGLIVSFPIDEPYRGTRVQRGRLRYLTSGLIDRYFNAAQLDASEGPQRTRLLIDPERKREVTMLKQLTWHYVILNPALTTQQFGQRKIIRDLFEIFVDAANKRNFAIFTFAYRDQVEEASSDIELTIRTVADLVSSLTDRQAVTLHRRLTGISLGSVLDRLELA